MVTSLTALRTHIRMSYGKQTVKHIYKMKFDPNKLLVELVAGTQVSPYDIKFYKAQLIESSATVDKWQFELLVSAQENSEPKPMSLPKRYATCLRILQKYEEQFKVIKTEHATDTSPYDLCSVYGGKRSQLCQASYGTYDIIIVEPQDEIGTTIVRARADFRKGDSYYICFLRRYTINGRDSMATKSEEIKWLLLQHIYQLCSAEHEDVMKWLDSNETEYSEQAQERAPFEFKSMSQSFKRLFETNGKSSI